MNERRLVLASLGFFLLVVATSCGPEDAGDPSGPGGKADDDTGACDGARLDPELFCRAPNGRYAAASCCAEELAATCADSRPDPDGERCRSATTGRFVPSACCASLCEGAAIDSSGFCRDDRGRFAPRACCADQCFAAQEMNLEADDFSTGGSCASAGCAGRAGDGDCFCDGSCDLFGDCCADKAEVCGGEAGQPSCAGVCGDSPNNFCFCDERCAENGDCCPDKVEVCGGAGDQVTDCADPCAGATLEPSTGICRSSETGRFVKQSCCAAAFAQLCAGTAPDADGAHCRRESGQFAPAICCESLCEGAGLDGAGACRLPGGAAAEPGCCADQCVTAQSRLGRESACGEVASN